MGKIPDNWIGCPKFSSGLVKELFFAFKTPLSAFLNNVVGKEDQFYIQDVVDELLRLKKDKVLWIDLTNTNRYYPHDHVSSQEGFSYLKMPMRGGGQSPSQSEKNGFNQAVDQFKKENPSGVVAVHCTHGFNRTGFLICSYLIQNGGLSPFQAVSEFNSVRFPGIYRQNYVDHLFKEGQNDDDRIISVFEPEWVTASNKNKRNHRNNTGNKSTKYTTRWDNNTNTNNNYYNESGSEFQQGSRRRISRIPQQSHPHHLLHNFDQFADDNIISNFDRGQRFDNNYEWEQQYWQNPNYSIPNYHPHHNNGQHSQHINTRRPPISNYRKRRYEQSLPSVADRDCNWRERQQTNNDSKKVSNRQNVVEVINIE